MVPMPRLGQGTSWLPGHATHASSSSRSRVCGGGSTQPLLPSSRCSTGSHCFLPVAHGKPLAHQRGGGTPDALAGGSPTALWPLPWRLAQRTGAGSAPPATSVSCFQGKVRLPPAPRPSTRRRSGASSSSKPGISGSSRWCGTRGGTSSPASPSGRDDALQYMVSSPRCHSKEGGLRASGLAQKQAERRGTSVAFTTEPRPTSSATPSFGSAILAAGLARSTRTNTAGVGTNTPEYPPSTAKSTCQSQTSKAPKVRLSPKPPASELLQSGALHATTCGSSSSPGTKTALSSSSPTPDTAWRKRQAMGHWLRQRSIEPAPASGRPPTFKRTMPPVLSTAGPRGTSMSARSRSAGERTACPVAAGHTDSGGITTCTQAAA
mmetsp:Transcript_11778/g.32248  ORF Transcript_11778/g.32248 Transcript_11778/m.32248 type:complete len:378 (+) Transcript_11778:292-1425(+)